MTSQHGGAVAGVVTALAVMGIVTSATLAAWTIATRVTHDVSPSRTADRTTSADPSARAMTAAEGFAPWEVDLHGRPLRWDPCAPIDLVVNDTGAPAGWRTDFDAAVDELAAVADLEIRVVATSDERPRDDRPTFQPDRYGQRWAPVLVAWSTTREFPLLRTHDRGVAIPVAVGQGPRRAFVTGQMVFARDRDDLRVGANDRAVAWRATFLHELGHLVGLAHVGDPDALMSRYPGAGPIVLSPGDRAGLAAVSSGGCIDTLTPRSVPVDTPTDPG